MTDKPNKDVVLMIADISGYTEFMLSSNLEIEHSQAIISDLIETIIKEIEIPLEVSKLEGDAIFLYALKDGADYIWDDVKQKVGEKMLVFFEKFHNKISDLSGKACCECTACSNVDKLNLKLVVHSGNALFYSIQNFNELSGGDVILVHRLLKNSTTQDEYVLMTEPAWSDLKFPQSINVEERSESYDHFGEVKTLVFYP